MTLEKVMGVQKVLANQQVLFNKLKYLEQQLNKQEILLTEQTKQTQKLLLRLEGAVTEQKPDSRVLDLLTAHEQLTAAEIAESLNISRSRTVSILSKTPRLQKIRKDRKTYFSIQK